MNAALRRCKPQIRTTNFLLFCFPFKALHFFYSSLLFSGYIHVICDYWVRALFLPHTHTHMPFVNLSPLCVRHRPGPGCAVRLLFIPCQWKPDHFAQSRSGRSRFPPVMALREESRKGRRANDLIISSHAATHPGANGGGEPYGQVVRIVRAKVYFPALLGNNAFGWSSPTAGSL